MPTRELASGPVQSFDYTDEPLGFEPAVVVGDAPQWGDNSDATYAECTGDGITDPARAYTRYEAVPAATLVNSLTVEGRYKTVYPSGTFPSGDPRHFGYTLRTDLLSATPDSWAIRTFNDGHPEAVNDDGIHDFTYQVFPAPWMGPEDVAAYEPVFRELLAAGPVVWVGAGDGRLGVTRQSTLTVYEFRLIVDYEVADVRKLRLYPRDDVLGFSGVARQYPPPRRGRNYGQQP